MRVVLDTNVILSAILFGGIPPDLLTAAMRGEITPVTSETLLDEIEHLLRRKFGFSQAAAREVRAETAALADVVDPRTVRRVCRDPGDDHVLAAAIEGQAELLITGDHDLLVLGAHEGIAIVTPAQAKARLASAT